MVDTIRVMNGEIGIIGSGEPIYKSSAPHEQATMWLPWIQALEMLSLTTGESLKSYLQVLREEYINFTEPAVLTSEIKRMLRLWKESTPFMLTWLRFSQTHEKQESFREENWHLSGLDAIVSYTESLPKNWSARGKAFYNDMSYWASDQSEWGRLMKLQVTMMDDVVED